MFPKITAHSILFQLFLKYLELNSKKNYLLRFNPFLLHAQCEKLGQRIVFNDELARYAISTNIFIIFLSGQC